MIHLNTYAWRKKIPDEIRKPVLMALSHYPELQTTRIDFNFSKKVGNHIMKAQPKVSSVLQVTDDVSYIILVGKAIRLGNSFMHIEDLPESVLVGWLGHELGHVVDYSTRSRWGLIGFGLGYLFSNKFVRNAEKRADEIAVRHGLGEEILETKNFILNHADLSERYKRKIRRLYLSPEQIMEIIKGETDLKTFTS